MLESCVQAGEWSLKLDGETVLSSKADAAFATAILREKQYSGKRGTVKVEVRERLRVPLRHAEATGDGGVCLSAEGHRLYLTPEETPGGVQIRLGGESGWAYEFCLPAEEDEAVFGGGEQYRKLNLRGEQVVNFVSEHIKASTIVEKALLPRALYREKKHSEIGSYAPMPVFVTDRGRLILFDTAADGCSDFSQARSFRFAFDACPDSLTLLRAGRRNS